MFERMADDSEAEDNREVFAPLQKAVDALDTSTRGDKSWYEESLFTDVLRRTSSGEVFRGALMRSCSTVIIDVTKKASLETREYKTESDLDGKFSPPLGAFVKRGLDGLSENTYRLRARVVIVTTEQVPVIDLAQISLLHRAYNISLPMLWYCFRITHSWPPRILPHSVRLVPERDCQSLFEQLNTAWSSSLLFSLGPDSTLFLSTDKSLKSRTIPTGKSDFCVRLQKLLRLRCCLLQSSSSRAPAYKVPTSMTRFLQHCTWATKLIWL